ncbi:MAG: hypothetical protein NC346_08765 [Prevotella sp.]|nr:hypothetical protein [Prevotella sp.]
MDCVHKDTNFESNSQHNSKCYDFQTDDLWDEDEKARISDEFEWIGQRGCQFKVLKKTGSRIILQLIEQLK